MGKEILITDLLDPEKFEQHKEELLSYFEKGGTWQDLMGYDDALMEDSYAKAYQFFEQGDFLSASEAFSFLVMLNPYHYDYWMGHGAAKQELKHFEEAVVSYTAAEAIEPENPLPHIQLALCYERLEAKDYAKEQLTEALQLAKADKKYSHLLPSLNTAITKLKV